MRQCRQDGPPLKFWGTLEVVCSGADDSAAYAINVQGKRAVAEQGAHLWRGASAL
jgi:hypothetical protein